MRNMELKARLKDMEQAEAVWRELGANHEGLLSQVDTYFQVENGRLKLRDFGDGRAELIADSRPDLAAARASEYDVQPVAPRLGELLAKTLGVVVVRKKRELYLWKNVRIHLDRVEQLGSFIEFEAVLDGGHDDADGKLKINYLRGLFVLGEHDIISGSYADLMMAHAEEAMMIPGGSGRRQGVET